MMDAPEIEDDTVSSEHTFFQEKDLVLATIESILLVDGAAYDQSFAALEKTLLNYLEQPHLICCHAEILMAKLNSKLLESVKLAPQSLISEQPISNKLPDIFKAVDKTPLQFGEIRIILERVCQIIYLLCRVIGLKHLSKHLPHEVNDLEGCLLLLRLTENLSSSWQTMCVLLMWLSTLCLIPFDIHSMDSSLLTSGAEQSALTCLDKDHGPPQGIVHMIISLCCDRLGDPGPIRDAAAVCLASLLTRPDMETLHLSYFIEWGLKELRIWSVNNQSNLPDKSTTDYFLLLGILRTCTYVYKKGHREKLLPLTSALLDLSMSIFDRLDQSAARKLLTKLIQRIGMVYLPPRLASWRYDRGNRSLNLALLTSSTSKLSEVDHSITTSNSTLSVQTVNVEVDPDIPSVIEDIVDSMLKALCDKDTVVRWSAAKGIGRISMRLTKCCAMDVVNAVLELFDDADADSNWHGGCLALAELSRRGLLLPQQLGQTMPLIELAIFYDIMRGQHSVGIHVRDAACYVCWAFARAYSAAIIKPYIRVLYTSLLTIAIFDREVNCRRAASAAFQEMVGRQGAENVPLGIELITIVDYFSLSNRANSFLCLSKKVARIDGTLRVPFMRHLLRSKTRHWDKEVRVLAASSFAQLLVLGAESPMAEFRILLSDVQSVAGDTNARHGSLLTLTEAIRQMALKGIEFDVDLVPEIVGVVNSMEKSRVYRGRGGELMRIAVCGFIDCIARVNISASVKEQVAFVEVLNENLKQPHTTVQLAARNALRSCTFHFFQRNIETAPSVRLQALTILKYLAGLKTDQNVAVTRGFAAAIGALPSRLVTLPCGRLEEIIATLEEAASPFKLIAGEHDANTSCNAVSACAELCEKLVGSRFFGITQFDKMLSILITACSDYSVDKRGDTGSWSRMAAMHGIERIAYATAQLQQLQSRTDQIPQSIVRDGTFLNSSLGLCRIRSIVQTSSQSTIFDAEYRPQSLASSVRNENSFTGYDSTASLEMLDSRFCNDHLLQNLGEGAVSLSSEQISLFTGTLLKQLAEKIDSVREVAGNILSRLIEYSGESRDVPSDAGAALLLPADRMFLVAAIEKAVLAHGVTGKIDWSDADIVFSIIGNILLTGRYFDEVISGLVVSVGGLSETISNKSTRCLLDFCEEAKKTSNSAIHHRLLTSISGLFSNNVKVDRIITPAVKTVNLLLRDGVIDHLATDIKSQFASRLFDDLSTELKGCANIQKLCSIIDTLILLVSFDKQNSRYQILLTLLRLLMHKYPRVRKYCADALYLVILSDRSLTKPDSMVADSVTDCVHFFLNISNRAVVEEVLSTTAWETGSKNTLLVARRTILEYTIVNDSDRDMMNAAKESQEATQRGPTDEHDSYEALVREAGY